MLKLTKITLALVLGLSMLQHASAATVNYSYSATVSLEIRGNQLATTDQQFFNPSVLISGSFDYDNGASPIPVETGTVYESIFNLTGSVDGNDFSDASGGMVVINNGIDLDPTDPNSPLVDFITIGAEGGPVANLDGFSVLNGGSLFTLVNVRLFWFSPNGDFLDDESSPANLAPQTEIARMALDFVNLEDPTQTHTVFADPLALTTAPVPLPAAAWLLMSGLGLLGLNRKRS